MIISKDTRERLNAIPLQDVMQANGHRPVRRSDRNFYYKCPLPSHDDSTPSFAVQILPDSVVSEGETVAGYQCLGCHNIDGYGAISLQAALMGIEPNGNGFFEVCKKLSKLFSIPLDGEDMNGFFHRAVRCEPRECFSFKETPWTAAHLEGLGCRVRAAESDSVSADGVVELSEFDVCSWGSHYYDQYYRHVATNFDMSDVTDMFGCYPVGSFITPQRNVEGENVSWRVESTPTYPVYALRTIDAEGAWRVKKYEPLCLPDKQGNSYKNTWYYEGNVSKREYSHMLYGDRDVMDALYRGAQPKDSGKNGEHPVSNGETGSRFRRVIICSGFRDAINVYYHSDAHVVYPHSESTYIDPKLLARLKKLAVDVYILFDCDRVGQDAARKLNLQFLDFRNIELPSDLGTLTDRRTGKRCKDVAGYFEFYEQVLHTKERWRYESINEHFKSLVWSAESLKFWSTHETKSGTVKYQLVTNPMLKFLEYNGLGKYVDEQGNTNFVFVKDNLVEMYPSGKDLAVNILTRARQLMKGWLNEHVAYKHQDLDCEISNARGLSVSILNELHELHLNFKSYGEGFDYLFFRNGALLVTADKMELVKWKDFPYHVNIESIIPIDYVRTERLFEIVENPEFGKLELEHQVRDAEARATGDARAVHAEECAWKNIRDRWQFILELKRPMNEMPVAFQLIYDTCRMYWRNEELENLNLPLKDRLTLEQRQFHDAHFVNKAGALGYILSRFRSNTKEWMVMLTDYRSDDESKSNGGTGKSAIVRLLGAVRRFDEIAGKNFKTNQDTIARNFCNYKPTVHGHIYIDDIANGFDANLLYDFTDKIVIKNLHRDERTVSRDMAAKLIVSSNRHFDLSAGSTRRRTYLMVTSDYYHPSSTSGMVERSPYSKFGYSVGNGDTPAEHQALITMLAQFLQFYLRYQIKIEPPMENDGLVRILSRSINNNKFMEFARKFFTGDVFGRPIPKNDLFVEFLRSAGEVVSKQAVRSRSQSINSMLMQYCDGIGITVNPDIVYRSETDRRNRRPRVNTYIYDFDQSGRIMSGRVRKDQQPCYYFYHRGHEPTDPNEVIVNPDTDVFAEGYVQD